MHNYTGSEHALLSSSSAWDNALIKDYSADSCNSCNTDVSTCVSETIPTKKSRINEDNETNPNPVTVSACEGVLFDSIESCLNSQCFSVLSANCRIDQHCPVLVDYYAENPTSKIKERIDGRRKCKSCGNRTSYKCLQCGVGLCIKPEGAGMCWLNYHSYTSDKHELLELR